MVSNHNVDIKTNLNGSPMKGSKNQIKPLSVETKSSKNKDIKVVDQDYDEEENKSLDLDERDKQE